MSATTVDLARVDADIFAAWQELLTCRGFWASNPSSATILAEQLAERRVNRLLDFRFAATHRTAVA